MRTTPQDLKLLYEDNHYIIANKRPGDIIQGDKTGDMPLSEVIKLYLKEKHNKPGEVFLGVIHRLDRPVSGAVLFAKTSKGLARANEMFASGEKISKTYWAIVEKSPVEPKATLLHYLKRNEKQNKSYAYDKEIPQSKRAVLHYTYLKALTNYHLLEINLETGRHHQIRCQLASIGCVIKGDLKYGAKRSNVDGSICLHAARLSFEHPIKQERVEVQAPPPQNPLWEACVNE